jgi:hypothetical protein
MTKEEAESLKPGDSIKGTWKNEDVRTITFCCIQDNCLKWRQTNSNNDHMWEYRDIQLVKRAFQNNDFYPIF